MSARIPRLGALVAVLAFLAPSPAAATPAPPVLPELPDQIAAGWSTDRVFVYDALRPGFPAAELARIRAATRTAPFPVYIALLPRTPYTRQLSMDLPTLLQARVGQPGLYLVWSVSDDYWSGTQTLIRPGGLKGRELVGVQLDDKQDNKIVTDRPAPRIVRTIQQAATAYDGRALPAVPAADLTKERDRDGDELSATDKGDRAAFIGMGAGGLIGFCLVIVITLRHRGKRPTPRKRAQSGAAGPVNVWSVRGKADRWIVKADKSLKRLEAKIKTARSNVSELLDQRDDASARLTAARTLRADDSDDLTAPAGAFVLARQANEAASGAAVQPPCFFNPLHEPGVVQAPWSDDTEVPACRSCAKVLERGETPRGFLVWKKSGLLRLDRKAVPYWTVDPKEQPLMATGFGALEDDLAERVGRQRGGDQ
ncbi:hypothetical protein [Streptomyces sp. SID13031]|uniref:hypothetical protein n=1 Tax=Streptomyces sp. SID13031 TaxID=2706046 RepID=UPI0013CC9C2F|nr:hypothetical protein [Streptomyces sp. SID13031]NEA36106.1 hypothetical protein [Streptomyces sp. SID13031]